MSDKSGGGAGSNGSNGVTGSSGLSPRQSEKTIVIFRCIVPVEYWYESADREPNVKMRFGPQTDGKHYDFGPGEIEKKHIYGDCSLAQIKFTCPFNSSVFEHLQYKYVVLDSKHREQEVLLGYDKDTSRLLKLPQNYKAGVYCQFDTIIYPEVSDPNIVRKTLNAGRSFFTGHDSSSSSSSSKILPKQEMRKLCLQCFLEPKKELLLSGTHNVTTVIDDILHIYDCCYKQETFTKNNGQTNLADSLKEAMMQWLLTTVEKIDQQHNDKNITSAITILIAYDKLRDRQQPITTLPVPAMLKLLDIICKCNEDSQLKSLRLPLQNALNRLFTDLINNMKNEAGSEFVPVILSLLKVLPSLKPSSTMTDYMMWDSPLPMVKSLRDTLTSKSGYIKEVLTAVKEYNTADQLLLSTVIYLCPHDHLSLLCDYDIPLHMILTFINHKLRNMYSLTMDQVERYLIKPLFAIQKTLNSNDNSSREPKLFPFPKRLLEKVSKLLTSSDTDTSAVVCCGVTVLTCAINCQEKESYTKMVKVFICDWIMKDTVIGGNIFGGGKFATTQHGRTTHLDTELKVWNSLFQSTEKHFNSCQSVKDDWMKILEAIIESRVSKISDNDVIQLFLNMERLSRVPSMISDPIRSRATIALGKEMESRSFKWWKELQHFVFLLTFFFPDDKLLNFPDVLKFDALPGFIKIYLETCSSGKQDLSQDWQQICARAVQVFESKFEDILSEKVTANDQAIIKSNQQKIFKIADILSSSSFPVTKCSRSEIARALNKKPASPELWGFCSKSDSSIIFRCILPVEYWYGSSAAKPSVSMRFGLQELGKWKQHDIQGEIEKAKRPSLFGKDHLIFRSKLFFPQQFLEHEVPGEIEKLCGSNLVLIKFTCPFDSSVFSVKKPFQYKYVVLDSIHNNKNEVLLNDSPDTNRLLQLLPSHFTNGEYCQYDTIIYPESAKSGMTVKQVTGCDGSNTSIVIPQNDEMRKQSLNYFLEQIKKLLIHEILDPTAAINDILHVYNCCYNQKVYIKHSVWLGHPESRKLEPLKEVMMQWLSNIVTEIDQQHSGNNNRILAITVLVAYDQLRAGQQPITTLSVPAMLKLSNIVCKCTRSRLLRLQRTESALNCLFTDLINNMQYNEFTPVVLSLLEVLPLLKPTMTDYMWKKPLPIIKSLHDALASKSGYNIEPVLKKCKSIDHPLLLSTVIYLCAHDHLPLLCDYGIPLHMIVTFINDILIGRKNSLTGDKVKMYLINPLIAIQKNSCYTKQRMQEPELLLDSFTQLLDKVSKLLKASDTDKFAVVCCGVTVVTCAINCQEKKRYTYMVERFICNWIMKETVIGEEMFGGGKFGTKHRGWSQTTTLVKEDAELKVWDSLLQYTENSCKSVVMKDDWTNILKTVIESRVSKISDNKVVIQLFLNLEKSHAKLHQIIDDAITSQVIKPLEQQFKSDQSSLWNLISQSHSTRTAKVFGRLLCKQYPDFNGDLKFSDLLKLQLWPIIIRLYLVVHSNNDAHKQERWHEICDQALEVFQSKCHDIKNGRITVNDLTEVKEEQNMLKIADMVTASKNSKVNCPNSEDLKCNIQGRVKELEYFTEFQQKMKYLVEKFKSKGIQEFEEFKSLVNGDTSNNPINTLCVQKNGVYKIVYYTTVGKEIVPHANHIYDTFKKHKSEFITALWDSKFSEAIENKTPFAFEDFISLVWQPMINECDTFMKSLKNKSVKLIDINTRLRGKYKLNERDLTEDLQNVNKVLVMCRKTQSDSTWIGEVLSLVHRYWQLCVYTTIAKTLFDQIHNTLQLTGDFHGLEVIAKMENDHNLSLESILNEKVQSTAEFLQVYIDDQQKKECFDMFCECQDTVKWIQSLHGEKKGDKQEEATSKALKNFVEVASGGDGDYNTDRLINLETVGSGFGPLIYQLPQTAGYDSWHQRCEEVWSNLKQNIDLPKILKYCEKEINWYKSIYEWHGSVEKTSFGQLDQINKLGNYAIGSIKVKQLSSRSEAICMRLGKPGDENISLARSSYSLNELKDLESKLALIVGPNSNKKTEVESFQNVFHTVCRIADVLIELQLNGNTQYIQWKLQFPCHMTDALNVLKVLAKKMEDDKDCWLKKVNTERMNVYELNYFTMPQILTLREELGLFSIERAVIGPSVMNLLQGISKKQITPEIMNDVIKEIELNPTQIITFDTAEQANVNTRDLENNVTAKSETTLLTSSSTEYPTIIQQNGLEEQDDDNNYPHPKINVKDLSQEEESLFNSFKTADEFHELLLLLAIEKLRNSSDTITGTNVSEWCGENENEYEYPVEELDDDNEENEDNNGESEDNGSSEKQEDLSNKSEQIIIDNHSENDTPLLQDEQHDSDESFTIFQEKYEDTPSWIRPDEYEQFISVYYEPPLDKNHHIVKELLKTDDYSLEEAIEAAAQCRNTSKAIQYLEDKIKEGFKTRREQQETNFEILDKMKLEQPETRNHMQLPLLGKVLQLLAVKLKDTAPVLLKRPLPPTAADVIKDGELNLVVVPTEYVLKTVLSLYMADHETTYNSLPTHEEVLICTKDTTEEEVLLFWKRALGDPDKKRIFCLVNAELLLYQVWDKSFYAFQQASVSKTGYRIVIICDEKNENVISKLETYRRPYQSFESNEEFLTYLEDHFKNELDHELAEILDDDKSVRIASSTRPGMGKSLCVKRLFEKLQYHFGKDGCREVIIPIHGPMVNVDNLVDSLCENDDDKPTIYHIDVSQSALRHMDSILFSLLILQTICDSKGQLWRSNPLHLYVVEVTIPQDKIMKNIAKSAIEFLSILPTKCCIPPRRILKKEDKSDLLDKKKFESDSFQRVFQYLQRPEKDLKEFKYTCGPSVGNHLEFLNTILNKFGLSDPSWSEVQFFINLLNKQLICCQESVFCQHVDGLKAFVIKFMIIMSKDFCSSSLKGEVAFETDETIDHYNTIQQHEIHDDKKWNARYHPYLFFNCDNITMTFVGFTVRDGNIIDPVLDITVKENAISEELQEALVRNNVKFDENYRNLSKQDMINKLGMVMGIETPTDPDPSYVLTADNVIKMFAILMKFRCNIPVVIMGETGCGKTRLIRYMCSLAVQKLNFTCIDDDDGDGDGSGDSTKNPKNMFIMKIHGGTTEEDIIEIINEAETRVEKNDTKTGTIDTTEEQKTNEAETRAEEKMDTIVFFDEANTTSAIGLIKEIMCDRRMNGKEISNDIKFIAACNPYKKHTVDMIKKLEGAGLGFYVKSTEAQEKLGEIPLRQLVYRVFDLPSSMKPVVYDFGKLDDDTEKDYTRQMVWDRCKEMQSISDSEKDAIVNVIKESQSYMRKRIDECSFVSLRDVERAMIVFKYFYKKRKLFCDHIKKKAEGNGFVYKTTWAIIMSLSVCYHARLQEREDFESEIVNEFIPPLNKMEDGTIMSLTQTQFQAEIRWCQEILLDNMILGDNIARNAALRENVFMMTVCIQLKIPLFLVGKPGSSKSLAKSIVSDTFTSDKSTFLNMQVRMVSYQCSQLSTPESIQDVFTKAKQYQETRSSANYTAVVVLDEVGLAEDSPNLPLKVLHPLLEDGTEGNDILEQDKRVAFIGISNWALDPAKMNRGVMVTRGDPNEEELIISAKQICSSSDKVRNLLDPYFKYLAKAYTDVCTEQVKPASINKSFFGLRDFYSLIKMLYQMCDDCDCQPTERQLEHAVKRNFGGLEESVLNTYEIFQKHLSVIEREANVDDDRLNPDCTRLGLIEKSLSNKEVSNIGDNRYLLFLTENYTALGVLKHKLHDSVMQGAAITTPESSTRSSITSSLKPVCRSNEPYILFGSSFPKDKEYTQVCRNINQIKICMETGRTIILLNLENLYESLYDLLNQYYITSGNARYVDLGLQTHRVKCRVDNNFKLILIAEKEKVYKDYPIPLINRLEKHFVLTETILLEWQKGILTRLGEWITKFSVLHSYGFTEKDAFVGIQKDTPAAVIFQVTSQFKDKEALELTEDSQLAVHKEKILEECYNRLLLIASPDALKRLERTELSEQKKEFYETYFEQQKHDSLVDFISNQLNVPADGLSIQISTHGHLLSTNEVNDLIEKIGFGTETKTSVSLLQQFDTEQDFTNAMDPMFCDSEFARRLLIIQCDSGHEHGNLVACARYRIDDMREKAYRQKTTKGVTHVIMIVHLPRGVVVDNTKDDAFLFAGFQGGSWISAHIDDIHLTSKSELTLTNIKSIPPISQLFYNKHFKYSEESDQTAALHGLEQDEDDSLTDTSIVTKSIRCTQPLFTLPQPIGNKEFTLCQRLQLCSQKVIAMIARRGESMKGWGVKMLKTLLQLIPKEPSYPLDVETFNGALVKRILLLLREKEDREKKKDEGNDWILEEACKKDSLQCDGTFQNVLTRRFDNEIIPMFANILSIVDCYSNLEIISDKNETLKKCLWFRLFNNSDICQFSYFNEQGLPKFNKLHETLKLDFVCEFPFFWRVKKLIDQKLDCHKANHSEIVQVLLLTDLAKVLCIVPDNQIKEYCEYYIHDFLCIEHVVSHRKAKIEYQVLKKALYSIMNNSILSYTEEKSLLSCLIAVHIAYQNNHNAIMLFGQMTMINFGILGRLQQLNARGYNSKFVDLHLQAVDLLLKENILDFDPEKKNIAYNEKISRLQKLKNVTNSILEVSRDVSPATTRIRYFWNYLQLMKTFHEHILSDYPELIKTAFSLQLKFQDECDFSKKKTIGSIQESLNKIQTNPRVFTGRIKKEIKNIKIRCKDFLAEVISTLCFGQYDAPLEPELVNDFISVVLDQQMPANVKDKRPFIKLLNVDSSPAVRSFLLQLLLEFNIEEVKQYLNANYFGKSRKSEEERPVCFLSIHCLEDTQVKRLSTDITTPHNIKLLKLLDEGYNILQGFKYESIGITFEYLEAVAKIRYVCYKVAKLLTQQHDDSDHSKQQLIKRVQVICQDKTINTIDIGPGIFLVKQIAREYDQTTFDELSINEKTKWIIPDCLKIMKDESNQQFHDPFSIYKEEYPDLRKLVHEAVYCCKYSPLEKLKESIPESKFRGSIAVIGAIYQVITMSHAYSKGDSRIVSQHVEDYFLKLLNDSDVFSTEIFSNELLKMGGILIERSYFERLIQMRPSLNQNEILQRRLTEVIIHAAIVFQTRQDLLILKPFLNILVSLENLESCYIPTFEGAGEFDDSEKTALIEGYHRCSNGHYYPIDESQTVEEKLTNLKEKLDDLTKEKEQIKPDKLQQKGSDLEEKPIELVRLCYKKKQEELEKKEEKLKKERDNLKKEHQTCPIYGCNKVIPPIPVVKTVYDKDSEFTGYTLKDPTDQNINDKSKHRGLTPKSCAIIRALINACLTWTACSNLNATDHLVKLCKEKAIADNIAEYFWNHFEATVKALSCLIKDKNSDNVEEACFVLHSVLKNISTGNFQFNTIMKKKLLSEAKVIDKESLSVAEVDKLIKKVSLLETEVARLRWENSFDVAFVHPVLKKNTVELKELQTFVSEYKPKDCSPLYYAIHEKRTDHLSDIRPHLWVYRPRITIETLFQKLLQCAYEFPVLKYLAKHDKMIRVTQYLPEIIKLQQRLCETYQWKVNEIEANKITVSMFLKKIESEPLQKNIIQQFDCMKTAWNFLKDEEVFKDYSSIDFNIDTLPITYLLPMERGYGKWSRRLIEELVKTHNSFLSHCDSVSKQQPESIPLKRFHIPLACIEHCHLVEYNQKLVSMILTNSCYKHTEQGYEVSMNLAALEKSFIDQFIHGRPKIKLKLPVFKFHEDASIFDCIKQPKEIPDQLKVDIISEMQTMQSLRVALDTVETSMGFLSSEGRDPKLPSSKLAIFITNRLKMKSNKALEHCNIEHVISLWTILSVELGKKLLTAKLEPFEGLSDDYYVPITDPDEITALNRFLHDVNINEILEMILKFIEMFVKRNSDITATDQLSDTMATFSDKLKFKEYEASFPKMLTVGQAVAVWKETAKKINLKKINNKK